MEQDNQLKYKAIKGNHILQPLNEKSKKAQELGFEFFEKMQLDYINNYSTLNEKNKYKISNDIANFFVKCFLNGDGSTYRRIVGHNSKGLMTNEELKNVRRDYKIAIKKKKSGEFKCFLLLDLLINSNRRADAVIIDNNYKLRLFDFSEGIVVDKIKKYESIDECESDSERKQFFRKQKQQKRIDSYNEKIDNDNNVLKDIIVDDDQLDLYYKSLNSNFYDFNYSYKMFLQRNRKKTYIPNSLCFLLKKEDLDSSFIAYPLSANIDSPFFTTMYRPIIEEKYINDIYIHNTFIGVSLWYLQIFFNEFTYFKVMLSRRNDILLNKNQVKIKKRNKIKYIYLKDIRTNKWIPFSYGLIEKHLFMNLDLKTWIKYIASLYNYDNDSLTKDEKLINYKKLKNSFFDFFII